MNLNTDSDLYALKQKVLNRGEMALKDQWSRDSYIDTVERLFAAVLGPVIGYWVERNRLSDVMTQDDLVIPTELKPLVQKLRQALASARWHEAAMCYELYDDPFEIPHDEQEEEQPRLAGT